MGNTNINELKLGDYAEITVAAADTNNGRILRVIKVGGKLHAACVDDPERVWPINGGYNFSVRKLTKGTKIEVEV